MRLFFIALVLAVFLSACGDSDSSSSYNTDIEYGALTDARDGQTYRTVPIGNQVWMAENLNYASPASICYGDDPKFCEKYGRLYEWNDAQDICPTGWHLPSRVEWWTLVANAGGQIEALRTLKSTSMWISSSDKNDMGIDSYGFSALPAAHKDVYHGFVLDNRSSAYFWSASEDNDNAASAFFFYIGNDCGPGLDSISKHSALSVRCLQDSPEAEPIEGSLTDERDGQIYKTVVIGAQTWMAENLDYAMDSSFCYYNRPEYCEEYGHLYMWADAQNACPAGWHLPDTTEWNELFYAVAGIELAGEVLKSKSYWQRHDWAYRELRDIYGFTALPAGYYCGQFNGVEYNAGFWSATEGLNNKVYPVRIYRDDSNASMGGNYENYDKSCAFSIRCVKD